MASKFVFIVVEILEAMELSWSVKPLAETLSKNYNAAAKVTPRKKELGLGRLEVSMLGNNLKDLRVKF